MIRASSGVSPIDPSADEQRMLHLPIARIGADGATEAVDCLAVEEPLEIRLAFASEGQLVQKSISITMRTPGHDEELAAGFLLSEGIIRGREDVASIRPCGPPVGKLRLRNTIKVTLAAGRCVDLKRLERHFYTSSSCGVCGKTSIAALEVGGSAPIGDETVVSAAVMHGLPAQLREAQSVFDCTGGLHASALFDADGVLRSVREDVGRHNALDKLIGSHLLAGSLPLSGHILLLSGRASFELIQKAVLAGIPIVAAVGAPSTLAVELAERYGVTLLGFVREQRFNVYTCPERVDLLRQDAATTS
jgi:FdhD protein